MSFLIASSNPNEPIQETGKDMNNKRSSLLLIQLNTKTQWPRSMLMKKQKQLIYSLFLSKYAARSLFIETFIKEKATCWYHTDPSQRVKYFIRINFMPSLSINQDCTTVHHKKNKISLMPRISTSKNDGRHCFFFDKNKHFYLLFINNLKNLTVVTVIKIYKRSLKGTTIYTRNCLIGNGLIQNFCFLLKNIEKLSLVEQYQNQNQMYQSLLLEKTQNHSFYRENQT